MADPTVTFAGCPTPVAPLGLGTWAWGDTSTWGMGGYDTDLTEARIAEAWATTLDAGVGLIDTAEMYGGGESERIIGRLLANDPSRRNDLVLATKFMPAPHKLNLKRAMGDAIRKSIDRLGVDHVDLYQVHGPISLRGHQAMAEALAQQVQDGLTRAVGVSNYSAAEVRKIHAALDERGVPLASNQVEYSLLRRRPATSGLLELCQRLGVVVLAYSPIGQGRLTSKYSADNPPPGRRTFSDHPWERIDPIIEELARIGEAHDRTPAQVALRWIIETGAVPIPGAKSADQARSNAGALGWELTDDDRTLLTEKALDAAGGLKNRLWQHG